jgi:hypothetical protein
MLGFSIQKLLFTIAVCVAVWYGFKWVGRMQVKRDAQAKAKLRRQASGDSSSASGAIDDAEEMVECDVCGAFVAVRGAKSCGLDDCPYPG